MSPAVSWNIDLHSPVSKSTLSPYMTVVIYSDIGIVSSQGCVRVGQCHIFCDISGQSITQMGYNFHTRRIENLALGIDCFIRLFHHFDTGDLVALLPLNKLSHF